MGKNNYEELGAAITDHLARVYSQDDRYKEDIKKEAEAYERLRGNLAGEQAKAVDEYFEAVCSTMGVCELLAYRQGMRDMNAILSGK